MHVSCGAAPLTQLESDGSLRHADSALAWVHSPVASGTKKKNEGKVYNEIKHGYVDMNLTLTCSVPNGPFMVHFMYE